MTRITPKQARVLNAMRHLANTHPDGVTAAQLTETTRLPVIGNQLRQLQAADLIRKIGGGHATRYLPIETP